VDSDPGYVDPVDENSACQFGIRKNQISQLAANYREIIAKDEQCQN
jgi:hypothetical protein